MPIKAIKGAWRAISSNRNPSVRNHDHDDGKVVIECLLKVEIFGRSAADERRFRELRPKVGKDGFHRRNLTGRRWELLAA